MISRQPHRLPTRGRSLASGALVWALVAYSGQAAAALPSDKAGDLTLDAIFQETGTWSTNPLMVVQDAEPLLGSTTSPEIILKKETPTAKASLDTKIDYSVFDQSDFNTTDVHATADLLKRNQRWSTGLQTRVDYDTTRTSELTYYGLAPVLSRHTGLNFMPQVSFNSSAVDTFALSGSAAFSEYDKNNFTDYRTFSLSPSYTRRFDPRNSGIFSLQAQQYETTRNNAARINTFGSTVGWQYLFSPRFTANGSVGAQSSRQYNFGDPTGPWKWEYIFSGGLSFKGVQDSVSLSTSRSQYAYGNGTEALQTSFTLKESHNINPLVSLDFGARYISSTYQAPEIGSLETLASGSIGASYHATEKLDVTASYQYRHDTLTHQTKTAQDNSVMIGLVYHPNTWTLGN